MFTTLAIDWGPHIVGLANPTEKKTSPQDSVQLVNITPKNYGLWYLQHLTTIVTEANLNQTLQVWSYVHHLSYRIVGLANPTEQKHFKFPSSQVPKLSISVPGLLRLFGASLARLRSPRLDVVAPGGWHGTSITLGAGTLDPTGFCHGDDQMMRGLKRGRYPLVNCHITMERSTMFNV